MLEGEKVKIRVRAYKKTKSGNEYGKYSGVLSFKTKDMYTKTYKNGKTKGFYSKWASEDAFVIQNNMRVKAGAKPLRWSDRIYEIASLRAYMMATKDGLTHAGKWRDEKKMLKKWGYSDSELKEAPRILGENATVDFKTPKEAMKSWKKSKGHYENLINKNYKSGAISVYMVYGFDKDYSTKWCSNFSPEENYDLKIK